MILGKIFGKANTNEFSFIVEKEVLNFEYVQIFHKRYGYVLGQIVDLIRDSENLVARCVILGYLNSKGLVENILEPFLIGTEVLYANDDFVKSIVMLKGAVGGFIGKLKGRDININLDLQKLLTKHLAVLAKSGAGKSYFVGCLLEEIIERKVPLLLIDTHGEYVSLKEKNNSDFDISRMAEFNIHPTGYAPFIVEYGNIEFNPSAKELKFKDQLNPQEIIEMLPSKLSSSQENLLFSVMKDKDSLNFDELIYLLEIEESPVKNQVINVIQTLKRYNLFSSNGVDFNELIQSGRCSIINLRGISPEVQEIIVSKLLKDLFELRKKNQIPPFFCVIEEAHNFCPERSFGQTKSSNIIRNIASEGRKFGLGLGVISQRPARIDKSVLSQVTTQVILKVTNPNDLKAIMNSVEGITSESEAEIQNLPIGSAMVTGIVDMPLFVNVRPRKSKHGGESINILGNSKKDCNFMEELNSFNEDTKEVLPIIMPNVSIKDLKLMSESEVEKINLVLIPGILCFCVEREKSYFLLIERMNGRIIKNIDSFDSGFLPNLHELSKIELKILENAFYLKQFKLEDFLKKFGGSFDIQKILDFLVEKDYLIKMDDIYTLNPKIILSNLSKYECFSKIEFKVVPYFEKKLPSISIDSIKNNLSKFVEVSEIRECFIGFYDVISKK